LAQEFTIKSEGIETKINQLLPSQGGFAPGVDFSASTMVVPIVDLTETAEGSNVRQDLQTAMSFTSITAFNIQGPATNSVILNTTGYYRVFGVTNLQNGTNGNFSLGDGFGFKKLFEGGGASGVTNFHYDFVVYLTAGQTLTCSVLSGANFQGNTRQIADIDGNLVSPL